MKIEPIKGLFEMKMRFSKRTATLLLSAFILFGSVSCSMTFESDNSIDYPNNPMCESDQTTESDLKKSGPPTEETAIITAPVPVSTTTNRYKRTVCDWVCGECRETDSTNFRECLSWVENCDIYAKESKLYTSKEDMRRRLSIKSTESGPYEGCGPTAIYNVAQYFDITGYTAGEIRDLIVTYQIIEDNISTTPSDLVNGFRKILSNSELGEISVMQHINANTSTIRYYLSQGYPVVALVQNGDHYVTITGFITHNNAYQYRVIDYQGFDTWVPESYLTLDVDISLGPFSIVAELVAADIGTWLPGTIFTFSQTTVWP